MGYFFPFVNRETVSYHIQLSRFSYCCFTNDKGMAKICAKSMHKNPSLLFAYDLHFLLNLSK